MPFAYVQPQGDVMIASKTRPLPTKVDLGAAIVSAKSGSVSQTALGYFGGSRHHCAGILRPSRSDQNLSAASWSSSWSSTRCFETATVSLSFSLQQASFVHAVSQASASKDTRDDVACRSRFSSLQAAWTSAIQRPSLDKRTYTR